MTGRPASISRAALFLAWLCFVPAAAAGAEDSPEEVSDDLRPIGSIQVSGHRTAEVPLILRTSGLAVGEPASEARMRRAIQSLYGMGLFSTINIVERPDSAGFRRIAIEVTENPRIESLEWSGNRRIGTEDLRAEIDLRPGRLLDRRMLHEARTALEEFYQEKGYASAEIVPHVSDPVDGRVDVRFEIEEGNRFRVNEVRFEGNQAFRDRDLRDRVKVRPRRIFRDRPYSAAATREDRAQLEEFYRNNGHMDAVVTLREPEFDHDRGRVSLGYTIDEGQLYRFGNIEWSGNNAVTKDALKGAEAARTGDPFSAEKLHRTAGGAYELYTEKGYLLEISVIPESHVSADTVHLHFRITEGEPSHVREVGIVGNTRTREHVIRREMTLFPGQLLRRSALMRSQRDVFALGFFEDVQIDYEPAGSGTDVNVAFRVIEKSSGTATAGAGYSSDTGLTGFVEFGHNNIFGRGQAVNLHLERGSRRETFDVSFTDPWAFGTRTSLGIHVYNMMRDYDYYTQKQRGGGLNAGRPWFFRWPDYTRIHAGYAIEDVDYTEIRGLAPESAEILKASTGLASRVSFTLLRNSTDSPFHPTRGSRTRLRLELTGGILGGDLDYFKPTLDHRIYFVPFWTPALMLRNRLTFLGTYSSSGSAPGSETFRLGGTRSEYLRGYPDYHIVPEENIRRGPDGRLIRFPGGKIAYIFTAEYQFTIVNPVRGLFFMDAGNTWNRWSDFSAGDLLTGFGAGIRLEIPMLGPIGFDYAYGQSRERWRAHFIIGPAF